MGKVAFENKLNQVEGWLKCKKRSCRSTKRKILDSSLRCNLERGTKTKKRYQYRSNLQSIIREISKLKFKKQHLEMLEEYCPFWSLCELIISKDITKQACKKSDADMKSLIKNFDKSKRAFYLGGKYLEITQQDVQQIFGISGGREKISLGIVKFQDYPLFKRRFVGLGDLTQAHISAVLEVASTGTSKEDFEDFPKLMTLFLLAVLFVPCKGVTLCWGYLEYVDDLEKMKKLDWAGHVFEKLHSSLCHNDNPEMVTGCVMALPYWVMNNFNISDPTNKDAHLLCQKWDLRDMAKATKLTIEDICLSKNQGEGSSRFEKRLARAVKRKTWGMGLGCDMQRAVSQTSEESQSCKKTRKSVDKSSDRLLKAWSPRAMESEKKAYLARANDSAVKDKDPSPTIPNTNGGSRENETERANDSAAKDKDPSPTIPNTNGGSRENKTEKQQTSENVKVNNSNFRIIIDGIDITSEIPERTLTSYISLCHTQNKLLHRNLPKKIPRERAASIISGIVTIASAIKICNVSTPEEDILYWGKALESDWTIGMDVGFMWARVNRLLDLKTSATKVVDRKKDEEAKAEGEGLEEKIKGFESNIGEMVEKIRGYELEIEKLREKKRKIDDEWEGVRKKGEEFGAMLKLEASAPW